MTDRSRLNRRVPAREMERFDEWCVREGHGDGGDKGRAAERALIEYLPAEYTPDRFRDDLDAHEEQLRAMCRGAGVSRPLSSWNGTREVDNGETVVCRLYVADDVQEALERFVYDREGKVRGVIGEYIARAFSEYRDGGQRARVRALGEALAEEVELVPADRITPIIDALEENRGEFDQIHIKAVEETAADVVETDSPDLLRGYAEDVLDELDFVAVTGSKGVYATPDRAAEIAEESAAGELDVIAWENMDRADRVRELADRVKARASSAATMGERCRVTYREVRDDILNGFPSTQYAYDLMEDAGELDGFRYHAPKGQKVLTYDADWEGETAPSTANETPAAGEETTADADTETFAAEAADELDALTNAQPLRADGGVTTEAPLADVDAGPVSPPEPEPEPAPAPEPEADRELPRLLNAICPTDGQILSADVHRDGREWECPRCRQRWTPDKVFPDV